MSLDKENIGELEKLAKFIKSDGKNLLLSLALYRLKRNVKNTANITDKAAFLFEHLKKFPKDAKCFRFCTETWIHSVIEKYGHK